jgi:hypothetical protein
VRKVVASSVIGCAIEDDSGMIATAATASAATTSQRVFITFGPPGISEGVPLGDGIDR